MFFVGSESPHRMTSSGSPSVDSDRAIVASIKRFWFTIGSSFRSRSAMPEWSGARQAAVSHTNRRPDVASPIVSGMERDEVIRRFAEIWWAERKTTLFANRWCGVPTLQHPFDAWVTQEIICEVRPDLILECGSYRGGSAVMWAMILEQVNPSGRVLTIDVEDRLDRARSVPMFAQRVDSLLGSTVDPAILAEVSACAAGKRTLVILDSDHSKAHVAAELDAYAPLVSEGSYLIVQDGVVNGHPVEPDFGPGPFEAVIEFLARDDRFEVDTSRERMLFTFNPNGFLRRRQSN